MVKKIKLKYGLWSIIISFIGVNILIFSADDFSNKTDKVMLLNQAVQNNTVDTLAETRGDFQFSMGNKHTGVILDGRIYMWGYNDYGQLGLGDTNSVKAPTLLSNVPAKATQLVLGYFHSAAVIDGQLYTWGQNSNGELGLGHQNPQYEPAPVTSITGTIEQLALGLSFSGAIVAQKSNTTDALVSKLYMWGKNESSQLGLGGSPTPFVNSPQHVTFFNSSVSHLALGARHSGVVWRGQLYTWGDNRINQLSHSSASNNIPPRPIQIYNESSTGTISFVLFSGINSLMIKDNRLYTWGDNQHYQLGQGSDNRITYFAQHVWKLPSGNITSAGITGWSGGAVVDNKLYTWGQTVHWTYNPSIHAGIDGNVYKIMFSTKIESDAVLGWNGSQQMAVTDKAIYCWGNNEYDQLGLGQDKPHPLFPIPMNTIVAFDPTKIITLDASNDKYNLRAKLANNVNTPEVLLLLKQFIASAMVINLPTEADLTINNFQYVESQNVNGKNQGQIITDFTINKTYFNGILDDRSMVFEKVNIHGFLPVNNTQIQKISATIPTENEFIGTEINQLVSDDASSDILKNWIIENSQIILGDVKKLHTINFPKNTKITKIKNIEVISGITGTIGFNIEVDKFYKPDEKGRLIESSLGELITMDNKIKLTGFASTIPSTITQYADNENEITAQQLLSDTFGYTDDLTPISDAGLQNLKQYVKFGEFPKDTKFFIQTIAIIDTDLTFKLVSNQYFNNIGVTAFENANFELLKFTGFLPPPPPSIPPPSIDNSWIVITFPILGGFILLALLMLFLLKNRKKQKTYNMRYTNTIDNIDLLQWTKLHDIKKIDVKNLFMHSNYYDIKANNIKNNLIMNKCFEINEVSYCHSNFTDKIFRTHISIKQCFTLSRQNFIVYVKTGYWLLHLGYVESSYQAHKHIPTKVLSNLKQKLLQNNFNKITLLDDHVINTWINDNHDWYKINKTINNNFKHKFTPIFNDTQFIYDPMHPININDILDLNNFKNKSVLDIKNNDLHVILNKQINSIVANAPSNYVLSIDNIRCMLTTENKDSHDAQIMLNVKLSASYSGGILTATPISLSNVVVKGFMSVNETKDINISAQIPASDETFKGKTMVQLAIDANSVHQKSLLYDWIKKHEELFIGNVSEQGNSYFPKNTKIVGISGFQICDSVTKTIGFNLTVDKYYKHVGKKIVESSTTDVPLTLANKIKLTGFEKSFESQIGLISGSNLKYTASQLLYDIFKYVDSNTPIGNEALINLKKYVNLDSFPANTEFLIVEPELLENSLAFKINANQHYNTFGVIESIDKTFGIFQIKELLNQSELIFADQQIIVNLCSFENGDNLVALLMLMQLNVLQKHSDQHKPKVGKNYANYAANYINTINYVNEWNWPNNTKNNLFELDTEIQYIGNMHDDLFNNFK